jgi:alkanesulfonate monooxygenase SsuD/methylene tetrahydromethanopterin reductase-like flavin-dependent oxidoreductase (luciferase family)
VIKMKYGLDIPAVGAYADARVLADLAAEAEQAGWDGFFVWDVFPAQPTAGEPVVNPWVALAAIALRTQRIRIGAFVTPLARRRPWNVACEALSVDRLSNGRLIFAAGLGVVDDRYFAAFSEQINPKVRADMLEEALAIITGLWTGQPYSFHGTHYQVDQVMLLPTPIQSPRIPVWVAGGWPRRKPFRRAAQWDGISLMTFNQVTNELLTPDDVRAIKAYITAQREQAEPFDIAVNGETPADPHQGAAIVEPYQAAGATWWIEYAASRTSFEAYRTRIRSGPPIAD